MVNQSIFIIDQRSIIKYPPIKEGQKDNITRRNLALYKYQKQQFKLGFDDQTEDKMDNQQPSDTTSKTSEISLPTHEQTLAMDYFSRHEQFKENSQKITEPEDKCSPFITFSKAEAPPSPQTLKVLSECSKSQKSESSFRKENKLVLVPKKEDVFLSPFSVISQKKSRTSPSAGHKQQRTLNTPSCVRLYEQEFFYMQFNSLILKTLSQRYEQNKEKELKYGSDPHNSNFDLRLGWKTINIAGTTNLTILRQFLLTSEWIDCSSQEVRLWASKITTADFQRELKETLKKGSLTVNSMSFISLDQLSSWYTIAHIQSKFSFPFFLIETKSSEPFLLQIPSTKCSNCKKAKVCLCLCLKPLYCPSCSNADQARLHKIRCKYSNPYELICEKMELKPLSRLGLVGLNNPNNMCYLNTALQCLLAVEPLTKYFLSRQYFRDLNPSNYLGSFGEITSKYAQFVSQAWCQSMSVYDPKFIRNSLGRFYNDFIESQNQHDSHECLSLILNFLRQDLNSAPPPKPYEEESESRVQINDEEESAKAWQKILSRNNSIVDKIFTVMIKSKIQCDKCNFASTTFEPALEVPLPVIPPSEKKVERKTINCLFIHQDVSQKNILVTLAVDKETLQEVEGRIRTMLNLKFHRKLAFYILSIHGTIERLTWKSNLSKVLLELKAQEQEFCCLEYSEEDLSTNSFAVTLTFQNQNRKSGTYENVSFKRPLFFNKIHRPKYGREVFKKILQYLYPRIYRNTESVSLEGYLNSFLNRTPPFRVFLSTDLINREVVEINSDEEIKLSVNFTEITARFQHFSHFQIEDLFSTRKLQTMPQNSVNSSKRQMIVTEDATLAECINQFHAPELILGWKCPNCKSNQNRVFRTQSIYEVSNTIIFYFKRFASTSTNARRGSQQPKKIVDPIKFPLVLDIEPFLERKCGERGRTMGKKGQQYRLKAVANHYQSKFNGSAYGHYIVYVQNKHGWFSCNDEVIKEMNSGLVCTPNAYYLLYQRIE